MKKLLTLLLLLAPSVLAQNPVSGGPIPASTYTTPPVNANPTHGTGAPSGNCMSGILYTNDSNGNVYACNAGTWGMAGAAGLPTGCTSPGAGAITCTSNVLAANLPPTIPTTPNGVSFIDTSTPAGGVGVSPVWSWPGVPGRSNAGATDAIVATDRGAGVLETNGGAVAVSLPQAGTTNFSNNFDFFLKCATTTVCTITPAAGQIAGNNGTLAATLVMPASSTAYCYSFDNANYQCGVVSTSSSTLSSLTAATGSNTIANGNNPQTWNWAQTTDSQSGITFGETSAATGGTLGNQYLVNFKGAAGSTAVPVGIFSSLTGSQTLPTLHITPTWNTSGVVNGALFINVTNTASGAASKLVELEVGSVRQFSVDKAGLLFALGNGQFTGSLYTNANIGLSQASAILDNSGVLSLPNNTAGVRWSNGGNVISASVDTNINRVSAGLLGVGTGTAGSIAGRLQAAGLECAQAADIGAQAANTATYMCPAAVTAWRAAVPAAAPAGIILNSNVAGLVTQSSSGDSNHAVHVTAQTATKTIYTLCPASAGGCNVAGQYRITWYFNQGGTACGTPAPGQVTFEVSWTDNAGAHTTVALPMNDNSSIAVFTAAFKFAATNVTGFASGEFNLWSTGAQPIQVTNTYTACAVGTGTWELTAAVEQVQ